MTATSTKRYIVTGAASGIGHAVAERLVTAGAEVISLDRNTPPVAVKHHIAVDLADPQSIDAAVTQLEGTFDALINVAGVPGTAPAATVIAVNVLAVRHLTEVLIGRLRDGGSVVVVSSIAGFGWPARMPAIQALLATDGYAEGARWFADNPQAGNAYNFSKEVATVYTMAKALEFAQRGLRINAVLPGPVETPILADFEETMGKDTLDGAKALLGRHATPEDIAGAVAYLISTDAGWVNGQTLAVDGGGMAAVAAGVIPAPEMR